VISRWEILAYPARLPPGRGYLLRIQDRDGVVGLGEARALEGFGSGPAALDNFVRRRDAVDSLLRALAAENGPKAPGAAATVPVEALFAAETALCDMAAQRAGQPLVRWLGFTPPRALPNSLLVGDKDSALRLAAEGHRNFKLKVRGRDRACLALLQVLLEACEGQAQLRLDANGSWQRDDVLWFTRLVPAPSIAYLEQPFAAADLDSCTWLRETTGLRLALDEAAVSEDALHEIARRQAADLVVIKPMYRGLRGALALARAAADCGLGACVTHAMDATPGRLATMHVAAAVSTLCPTPAWPHGLQAPGLTRLATEPAMEADRVLMPTGIGLGYRGLRQDQLEPVCASV